MASSMSGPSFLAAWAPGRRSGCWASTVTGPRAGKSDIMEQAGRNPASIEGTIHTQASAGTAGNGGATTVPDACSGFHDYQLTWTPDSLAIGVDGKVYYTYPNPGKGSASWPFDNAQYLLLNLAIGGDMGGAVDDAIFPVQMEVDYVRVYQKR
jgi:beta-glucanase (GH16 family)